jgi:hypothetical protein
VKSISASTFVDILAAAFKIVVETTIVGLKLASVADDPGCDQRRLATVFDAPLPHAHSLLGNLKLQ